jgi:hypothetical protein
LDSLQEVMGLILCFQCKQKNYSSIDRNVEIVIDKCHGHIWTSISSLICEFPMTCYFIYLRKKYFLEYIGINRYTHVCYKAEIKLIMSM